jgi:hypothetical protein
VVCAGLIVLQRPAEHARIAADHGGPRRCSLPLCCSIEHCREEVRVLDAVALALLLPELERRLVFEAEVQASTGHPEREADECIDRRSVGSLDLAIDIAQGGSSDGRGRRAGGVRRLKGHQDLGEAASDDQQEQAEHPTQGKPSASSRGHRAMTEAETGKDPGPGRRAVEFVRSAVGPSPSWVGSDAARATIAAAVGPEEPKLN